VAKRSSGLLVVAPKVLPGYGEPKRDRRAKYRISPRMFDKSARGKNLQRRCEFRRVGRDMGVGRQALHCDGAAVTAVAHRNGKQFAFVFL
jgi:hypothetical protein